MLFSSPIFLFLFLPVVLALYFLAGQRLRNGILLAASLLFYAWGEPSLVVVMLLSIAANYCFGLWVDRVRERPQLAWLVLIASVIFNIGLLAYFKYTLFAIDGLNAALEMAGYSAVTLTHKIIMPVGISFYTFQAMSYVIDVYRRETDVQRNPFTLALYITLFPQLIAGPIVRYVDVAAELAQRQVTSAIFADGIQRFVLGLGKKMLIANTMAVVADSAFDTSVGQLTQPAAWLGLICYAFQIYYDFSGYSDMAIGLGLMFGFRFVENFNYPYISRSITEFWRRWHISLSTWFRDYVYIPLGGNRHGAFRTYVNLVIVFSLCGLWHGASWNFVLWGLFYGVFLVIERMGLHKILARCWVPVQHTYTILVVLAGWVFFRAPTLEHAVAYFKTLLGFVAQPTQHATLEVHIDQGLVLALIVATVFATPALSGLQNLLGKLAPNSQAGSSSQALIWAAATRAGRVTAMLGVLLASASMMLAATYNPFIYFRF